MCTIAHTGPTWGQTKSPNSSFWNFNPKDLGNVGKLDSDDVHWTSLQLQQISKVKHRKSCWKSCKAITHSLGRFCATSFALSAQSLPLPSLSRYAAISRGFLLWRDVASRRCSLDAKRDQQSEKCKNQKLNCDLGLESSCPCFNYCHLGNDYSAMIDVTFGTKWRAPKCWEVAPESVEHAEHERFDFDLGALPAFHESMQCMQCMQKFPTEIPEVLIIPDHWSQHITTAVGSRTSDPQEAALDWLPRLLWQQPSRSTKYQGDPWPPRQTCLIMPSFFFWTWTVWSLSFPHVSSPK